MKSKFLQRVNQYIVLKEQDEEQEPQETQETEEGSGEESKVDRLSPESEVLLIRLLKKAMIMILDEEDIDLMDGLDEINETNAKEALKTIVGTMKKYSSEIDIR